MTRAERCSIITLGNRDMAESKTFKQMAAACFKSLLEQNIHYSLLNKTAAGTIMSPHYAGTQGQVSSGKIQKHTHNQPHGTSGEGWGDTAFHPPQLQAGFDRDVLPTPHPLPHPNRTDSCLSIG